MTSCAISGGAGSLPQLQRLRQGGGRPETVTSRWRERKYTVSEYIYIYIYTHLQLWWFVVGLVVGGFPGTQATGFVVDQLSLIGSDPI
jgi:hypothetical protein